MNAAPRAQYREPSLTHYGSIAELTQAGGSLPSGGGGGVSAGGSVSVGGANATVGADVTLP